MERLATALGRPQSGLRFIHLAGTNGKGSTAAFCESCLRVAGYRVGLYTSPHLVSVRERIQIDRQPISEADFAKGMEMVRRIAGEGDDQAPTFFEIMTALALWYFGREKVDWVVWETGLGGRLDATNIVRPEISIITNIGLDHQAYLGGSIAEIATEKAGIIKPRVPVISAVESGEAAEVIRRRAQEEASPLMLIPRDLEVEDLGLRGSRQMARIGDRTFALGLIGPHQVSNAACAVAALRKLGLDPVTDAALARGLENTVWSGRFEILSEEPLTVLDGAHNPAGVRKLVETWRALLAARHGWIAEGRAHLVFASVSDKDISEMAQLLRPLAREVSLVRLANERSAEPSVLAEAFADLPCTLFDSVAEFCGNLMTVKSNSPILMTGSLFLVGEMLAQRGNNTEEYRLNERLEPFTPSR